VRRAPAAQTSQDAPVGDLGSGSDYTVFLQRLGVPATDISSSGNYGVYHSVFDNFAWFKKFGDPDFVYEQQMARVYGLQMIRMADVDILPYQYDDYAKEIGAYIGAAQAKAQNKWAEKTPQFGAVLDAAKHFQEAGAKIAERQTNAPADAVPLDAALRDAERALLELHRRAPDLPAGFNVDGKGPLAVDDVHDAVVDGRRGELAAVVHQAGRPRRRQAFDVRLVDLLERAVALAVVAHALGGDVFCVLTVADEFFRGLSQSQGYPETE
jgi:hypothetical protein